MQIALNGQRTKAPLSVFFSFTLLPILVISKLLEQAKCWFLLGDGLCVYSTHMFMWIGQCDILSFPLTQMALYEAYDFSHGCMKL